MKAIMIMFDSLNRHFLPNYGCSWTVMHNFSAWLKRLLLLTVSMAEACPVCPHAENCTQGATIFFTHPGALCNRLTTLSLSV